jgi:hypothetical protein
MTDVEEFNRIADLMEMEGRESSDKRLVDYAYKLRLFALVVKVIVIYPKIRQVVENNRFLSSISLNLY